MTRAETPGHRWGAPQSGFAPQWEWGSALIAYSVRRTRTAPRRPAASRAGPARHVAQHVTGHLVTGNLFFAMT